MATLGSRWDGLSEHLIAHFYALDKDGNLDPNEDDVMAPLVEGANMTAQFNWQSPFEHMGPESKAPAITALLQSGALSAFSNAIQKTGDFIGLSSLASDARSKYDRFVDSAKGRTGITKINSTQIFNGMPPLRMSITLLFRAWKDPVSEVEAPLQQLWRWAAPIKLAQNGVITGIFDERTGIEYLLPSQSPTRIRITYANRTYEDMVIESIEEPITSPRDKNGNYTKIAVPMQIASLAALDRADFARLLKKS